MKLQSAPTAIKVVGRGRAPVIVLEGYALRRVEPRVIRFRMNSLDEYASLSLRATPSCTTPAPSHRVPVSDRYCASLALLGWKEP